jgi:hypothetical protein
MAAPRLPRHAARQCARALLLLALASAADFGGGLPNPAETGVHYEWHYHGVVAAAEDRPDYSGAFCGAQSCNHDGSAYSSIRSLMR